MQSGNKKTKENSGSEPEKPQELGMAFKLNHHVANQKNGVQKGGNLLRSHGLHQQRQV